MKRALHARWLDWLAPGLLLATPFLIFLRHDAYPILAPESVLALAGLFALGAALGALARRAGDPGRVLLLAALGTLLFDVQRGASAAPFAHIAICFALLLAIGALLRRQLAPLVCVTSGAAFVATLLFSVGAAEGFAPASPLPERHDELPLVVHIILDEQIGVEGLPEDVDPERAHADALKRFYLERGFQLFGRAYSISTSSKLSISNLLNFELGAPQRSYATKRRDREEVSQNAYFAAMAARGYRIHVRQSDYLDYCSGEASGSIERCETYPLETIGSIAQAPLAVTEKIKVMGSMYVRLSPLLSALRETYSAWQPGVGLPAWETVGRVSAASVMPVFEALQEDLSRAGRGELHFAHLMLPHFPYAYDASCAIRPRTADWLTNGERGHFPLANSEASRALRYERYLEQVACTHRRLGDIFDAMQSAGNLEGAQIIVHGDHGSRIFLAPLDVRTAEQISERDFLDAFPTLFAVRTPGAQGGATPGRYDLRMLSIAEILRGLVVDGGVREGEDWIGAPTVYLTNAAQKAPEPRAMPTFERGRVYSKR